MTVSITFPYYYFIIVWRFIENVVLFQFRFCGVFRNSWVLIHVKSASKTNKIKKIEQKKRTDGFTHEKPVKFTPAINISKITRQWKSTFSFSWFLLVLLWLKNTTISVRLVIEASLLRNHFKAFLSLFMQKAYHLRLKLISAKMWPF